MTRLFVTFAVLVSPIILSGCDEVPDPSLPNVPPIARDDSIALKQNAVTPINILANDFDIDGDTLEVAITQEPSVGTLEEIDGIYFYSPELYFIGSDEFSYRITDTSGNTDSATVSIEVQKKEIYAIFSTTAEMEQRFFLLDSREPGTLIDLAQAVPAGETVINWDVSEGLQLAVFLTDANRVLTVSLEDPATVVDEFEIDLTNGAIDGGLTVSATGRVATLSLDNRFVIALNLEDGETLEFDSGFDSGSTMSPEFLSITDTSVVMQGTLGTDAEERSAIYVVPLSLVPSFVVLDDAASLQTPFTRLLGGRNSMLWLVADPTTDIPPATYSCASPPPQVYSAPSITQLGLPGPGINLNEASGLLEDPTSIISYNNAAETDSLFVAACPPDVEIFQIIEIPYLDAASARVVTSATDASDGLWNIDVAADGTQLIYSLEGDTGLRTKFVDLSGDDPAVTDLNLPDYQTYAAGMDTRAPPSVFSSDGLRWAFLAPVADVLNRLVWLQLEDSELTTLDLPFTATNLLSDGLFAVVQGETAGAGNAPVALIEFADPQIDVIDVPGSLAETIADPLNQIESAIRVITVP
ncbi:MAG: Ig-like domain-containing protein [Gammaproteobacteria bacterium]|nr:Ig-like domain-containing protein [Gammaproteobacteria bacterium]